MAFETLVVDASVAVKWYFQDEEHAEQAQQVFERFVTGDMELFAPDYIRYEVPAVLSVATRGRQPRFSPEEGRGAIEDFSRLGIPTYNSTRLLLDAYPLIHRYDIALYDALYLALAERLSLPLITADRRCYLRMSSHPSALWIASWQAAR
ncbi:MAG: type II toxin-antitoxin system VapC family toxin [Dehalococcoidia bacterium]